MHVKENKLLLSGIPKYYGLKQIPLQYTSVSYDGDWLVIGTEAGVLICYNEESDLCFRIPPQGYRKIECLELKHGVVVWGTESGCVGLKEITPGPDQEQKQVIKKLHDSNVNHVTHLNNKVASVDRDGNIALSEVSWNKGVFTSSCVIHSERVEILSLFFISAELILLTTVLKSSVLKMDNGISSVTSVGSKDRKMGEFGACVLDKYTVLVARPGLRLWYANTDGDVLKTIQLRNLLKECQLESSCQSVGEDTRLASFLPKSGIINRVERIDEKLLVVQLKQLFIFVETVDLTVVGWLRESPLNWCTTHRTLVLLYKDNHIKRYIVSHDDTSELRSSSENVVNKTVNNSGRIEESQIVEIIAENGISNPDNEIVAIISATEENGSHKLNEMIVPVPKYKPIPKEKLAEITNFVKTICERDDNSETDPEQQVSNFNVESNEIHSISCDAIQASNGAIEASIDVIQPSSDAIQSSDGTILTSNDSNEPSKDVLQLSNSIQSLNDTIQLSHDADQPSIEAAQVIQPATDIREVEVTLRTPGCEDAEGLNTEISDILREETADPSAFIDHSMTPNDNTLTSCNHTLTPQDFASNTCDIAESYCSRDVTLPSRDVTQPSRDVTLPSRDVTLPSHDVTLPSRDVNQLSRDVTLPSRDVTPPLRDVIKTPREPTITVTSSETETSGSSEQLEMLITDSLSNSSSEKSVMEELKTNLGKKMITSFGLTPSPSKHKQLITSDITLPIYEPDKISLSSQDTISIHSSSTNCDEDEDRIAVRIKRKKNRSRKEKTSSNDTLDSIASGTLPPEHLPPSGTILEVLQEPPPTSQPSTGILAGVCAGSELGENSEDMDLAENSQGVQTDIVIGLDVGSILTGLDNLGQGVLRLDDLGLPVLEFDDPYEEEEEEEEKEEELHEEEEQREEELEISEEREETTDLDQLSVQTSSTVVDRSRTPNFSDNSRTTQLQRTETSRSDGDVYSARSVSESTAELYDLERRASVEYGEDPLTNDLDTPSGDRSVVALASPTPENAKSRDEDDNVFLTNDSWLELRGPTMSRIYVTISCLAVSSVSVWCTDNWGTVYYSPNSRGHSLCWERVPGAKLSSLSVSDSGYIVWGVTTNKRAVVRFGIDSARLQGTDWSEMMLEAVTVAVDESCVWLLVSNGRHSLFFREGVTQEDPQGEKWVPVSTQNLDLTSLSVNSSVVWGVLDSGKLVVRHGISDEQPLGNSWHVLSVNNVKGCHVGRDWQVGGVVDSAGIVHFQCGVVPAKPRGSNLWWQVSVSEQLGSNFVTHVTAGLFSGRRRTLDVKQVCTSTEGGVWLLSNYNTLHRRYGIITGHNWANISRTIVSGRREEWHTLAGEGAYPDISGPVWGLNQSGEIVCFTRSSPPRVLEPPCSQGKVLDIAATTNVLWAVDQSGQIHVRQGLARDNVMGTGWQSLNMAQMSGVLLHKLSCSDRGVWAVDSTGTPWFRTGCYAGRDTVQAWVRVESDSFKFREVSAAGSLVWGVDVRNSVYVRTGVSYSLPVGAGWEHVPGLQCLHVRAAQGGVVALSTSQHLVYRHGACPTLPAGNYWRKVPGPPPDGSVSLITTLRGGGVWCQSGRSNLLYRRRVRTVPSKEHVTHEQSEDGWEVV